MDSTVIENMETTDDRLEIVLRDPLMNSRQIKLGFVAVVLLSLAPVIYSILGIFKGTGYSSSGFVLLIAFSGLGALTFLLFLMEQINKVHRLVITPSAIEFTKNRETKTLLIDDICEILLVAQSRLNKSASLEISISLAQGATETLNVSASELISSGKLTVLIEGLRTLKKPLVDAQKAIYAIHSFYELPAPSGHPELQKQLGNERIRIKIFEGNERTKRFKISRGQILLWAAVVGLCAALAFIYEQASSALFPIAIAMPAFFLLFRKPLWLVVGTEGIGVWSNGTLAYGVPLKAIRSVQFEESALYKDDNPSKVSFQFLNGEELRFELKPRTLADRETLRQIAKEFKELKHGD